MVSFRCCSNNAAAGWLAGALILGVVVCFYGFILLLAYLGCNICCAFLPSPPKIMRSDGSDHKPALKRGRSSIEEGLSFRDRILDLFFLREKGDRETVALLMRGMPLPCCYGFPGCGDGRMTSNAIQFVKQFHPLLSIWHVHALHPFTAPERFVVFMCTVAFNFLWSAVEMNVRFYVDNEGDEEHLHIDSEAYLYLKGIKYVSTMLYAILIRQLVICPCLYAPLIHVANHPDDMDDEDLGRAAEKLVVRKQRGDRWLMLLYVCHLLLIVVVLIFVAVDQSKARKIIGGVNPWGYMATSVASSEAINFFVWFVKFIPLFMLLFPIHRGQWFQGGTSTEGLRQWFQAFSYLFFPSKCILRQPCREKEDLVNFRDPSFPRCVRPETTNLHTKRIWSFADIYEAAGFSTFRRADLDDFFKPPDDDVDEAASDAAVNDECDDASCPSDGSDASGLDGAADAPATEDATTKDAPAGDDGAVPGGESMERE